MRAARGLDGLRPGLGDHRRLRHRSPARPRRRHEAVRAGVGERDRDVGRRRLRRSERAAPQPTDTVSTFAPFSMDCGVRSQGRCDAAHQTGNDPNAPGNTRNVTMPGEPFGLAQSADGTAMVLTSETDTESSLLTTGLQPSVVGHELRQPADHAVRGHRDAQRRRRRRLRPARRERRHRSLRGPGGPAAVSASGVPGDQPRAPRSSTSCATTTTTGRRCTAPTSRRRPCSRSRPTSRAPTRAASPSTPTPRIACEAQPGAESRGLRAAAGARVHREPLPGLADRRPARTARRPATPRMTPTSSSCWATSR